MSGTRMYIEAAVHPWWGAPEEAMNVRIINNGERKVPDGNKKAWGKLGAKYTVTKETTAPLHS